MKKTQHTETYLLAEHFASRKLNVIPFYRGEKRPALKSGEGKKWSEGRTGTKQFAQWFDQKDHEIGFMLGKSSGNLCVLDFETKRSFYTWRDKVRSNYGQEILPTFSKSGIHAYVQTPNCPAPKSQVLAKTHSKVKGHAQSTSGLTTLIEVLGITEGESKKVKYYADKNNKGINISLLMPSQLAMFLSEARKLSEAEVLAESPLRKSSASVSFAPKDLPGDRYNALCLAEDVMVLLADLGWTLDRQSALSYEMRRPGKGQGSSGSVHLDTAVFSCHTSSANYFQAGKSYSPFTIFAYRWFGDSPDAHSRAAKALREKEDLCASLPSKEAFIERLRPLDCSVAEEKKGEDFSPRVKEFVAKMAAKGQSFSGDLDFLEDKTPDTFPQVDRGTRLYSMADLDSFPDPSWQVDGVILDQALQIWYGPASSFKSFTAIDLALHISYGREWFGNETKQGGVVFVAGEGLSDLKNRITAWRQRKDLPVTDQFAIVDHAIQLGDQGRIDEFCRGIDASKLDPNLIIFDTLTRCSAGKDGNLDRDTSSIVHNCNLLQKRFSSTILLIHHTRKDKTIERGSTVFRDSADEVSMFLPGEKGFSAIMKQDKIKISECLQPYVLTFAQEEITPNGPKTAIRPCTTVAQPLHNRKNSLVLESRILSENRGFSILRCASIVQELCKSRCGSAVPRKVLSTYFAEKFDIPLRTLAYMLKSGIEQGFLTSDRSEGYSVTPKGRGEDLPFDL